MDGCTDVRLVQRCVGAMDAEDVWMTPWKKKHVVTDYYRSQHWLTEINNVVKYHCGVYH